MRKKLLALTLSLALMLGLSSVAGAAEFKAVSNEATSNVYSVSVKDKTVSFIKGGKTIASYAAKSTDLKVQLNTSGKLIVSFTDGKSTNVTKNINLGSQNSLSIGGTANSITLNSSLKDNVSVSLSTSANVSKLTVNNTGDVSISGKVSTLTVAGGATVKVLKGASVNEAKVTSKNASLTAASGSTVKTVSKVSGATVSGSGIKKTTRGAIVSDKSDNTAKLPTSKWDEDYSDDNPDGIRVKLEKYDTYLVASPGDRLKDLRYDLQDAIRGYVSDDDSEDDGKTVYGECQWLEGSSKEVVDGQTYNFKFVPKDSSKYRTARSSILVRVQ